MSINRYIHSIALFEPCATIPDVTLKELKQLFPPLVSRRLTKTALMLASCMRDQRISADTAVIYTTTYSETLSLEKYLESFPTPSPLMFQNSIHPAGMEQVCIAKKTPVEEFFSFAGDGCILIPALAAAFTSEKPEQLLVGAEERGTWLTDLSYGSDLDFAFAVRLTSNPEGALARIVWEPNPSETPECLSLLNPLDFVRILQERRNCMIATESLGLMTFQWMQ